MKYYCGKFMKLLSLIENYLTKLGTKQSTRRVGSLLTQDSLQNSDLCQNGKNDTAELWEKERICNFPQFFCLKMETIFRDTSFRPEMEQNDFMTNLILFYPITTIFKLLKGYIPIPQD